jgi:preprotein translocase subunit SecF
VLITGFWAGTYMQDWFNFGIDFRAGLSLQVQITGVDADQSTVKDAITGFVNVPQVQQIGDVASGRYIIRVGEERDMDNFKDQAESLIVGSLKSTFGSTNVIVESSQFVGARFAGNLATSTLWLTLSALALILVYIWIRFKFAYAISAIAAIFHDVLFLSGLIGLFQLEVSTATVAAVLTIIGYSLNDTIVIFDRIRENVGLVKDKHFQEIIDQSISQSVSRTLITSLTTLNAVVAIFVFSTGTIKDFALDLIVGVMVGTYSSIFIASTILLSMHNRHSKKAAQKVVASKSSSSGNVISMTSSKSAAEIVKQSADEIAEATEKKKKKKKKKKK